MCSAGIGAPRILGRHCGIYIQKAVIGCQRVTGRNLVIACRIPFNRTGVSAGNVERNIGNNVIAIIFRSQVCVAASAGYKASGLYMVVPLQN